MCWWKVFVVSIHEFIQVVQVLGLSMLLIFKVTLANHQKNLYPTSKLPEVKSTVFQEDIQEWRLNKTCPPKAVSQHQPCSTMILQPICCVASTMCACSTMILQPTPPHTHTPTPPISWVDSTMCQQCYYRSLSLAHHLPLTVPSRPCYDPGTGGLGPELHLNNLVFVAVAFDRKGVYNKQLRTRRTSSMARRDHMHIVTHDLLICFNQHVVNTVPSILLAAVQNWLLVEVKVSRLLWELRSYEVALDWRNMYGLNIPLRSQLNSRSPAQA